MKLINHSSFSTALRLALVIALAPIAAGTARAENPFKKLGSKVRQGLSKVTKTVNPKRLVTIVRDVKNAVVDEPSPGRIRPVPSYPSPETPHSGAPPYAISPGNDPRISPATVSAPQESGQASVIADRVDRSRAAPQQPAIVKSTDPPLTKPAARAVPRQDLPFGELVPGKIGFVKSPWSKTDLVDVSGIPTGTKVKCPYTGKTFRVP